MSLEMCVLGSGSSGNASLIRAGGKTFLIDAGFGPRTLAKRLVGTGVDVTDIAALCLTHLDTDHFTPSWLGQMPGSNLRIFVHQVFKPAMLNLIACHASKSAPLQPWLDRIIFFDQQSFSPVPTAELTPLPLAHDRCGSQGFVLQAAGHRLGYATDLGHVPAALLRAFVGVDILAIEANYDPAMQLQSQRPAALKQRIMGSAGHLSNEQAYAAVQYIFDHTVRRHGTHCLPRHVVLLHRSRQCNDAGLLQSVFAQDPRIAPTLTLSHQSQRTEWLRLGQARPLPGEQLGMFAEAAMHSTLAPLNAVE